MEFNKGFRIGKRIKAIYKIILTLSILVFILITGYKIYLYFNYDINCGILSSFQLKKVSNSLVTPEVSMVKDDGTSVYNIAFKKLANNISVNTKSNYIKSEDGKLFFISKLDALKLVKESFKEESIVLKNYVNIPIIFDVSRNGDFQRQKIIKLKVPLSLDEETINPSIKETMRQKQRVTSINFDESLSFLNITTDNKYVSKDSSLGFTFNQGSFINDLPQDIKDMEEIVIPFNIELLGIKVVIKDVKLIINTIPYIDKQLMTPKLGVNNKYLDEIHTFEFTPVEGVDIEFTDSFIKYDGDGKYSFKSIDALASYNIEGKPSLNYTANFEFVSHNRVIGKNKVIIKLKAKTVCNLDEIEATTYNDFQVVSGYVPSNSTVYVNETEVKVDASDPDGYRFSTEINLVAGENPVIVRVVRQGEIPYEKTVYIIKESEFETPQIEIPEVTYISEVNVFIKTLPSYKLYINDEQKELDWDGSVSLNYNLLSGYGGYKFDIRIYDEFDNLVYSNIFHTNYSSGY